MSVDSFVAGAATTEDTSLAIEYDNWAGTANASASGGNYRSNGTKGAVAKFSFIGTSIDWITAKGPTYGKATVCIDTTSCQTVDLYAKKQTWQVALTFAAAGAGPHTIEVKPTGTRNLASAGNKVVVDAFRGQAALAGARFNEDASINNTVSDPLEAFLRGVWGTIVGWLAHPAQIAQR